jgi:HAD superfamily phosphoserine phosphatase-like hydrolase
MPTNPTSISLSGSVKINPFKLYYFRKHAGLSLKHLAIAIKVSQEKLRELERGSPERSITPESSQEFASTSYPILRRLEGRLNCKGKLTAGTGEDFSTQYVNYYVEYKLKLKSAVSAVRDKNAKQEDPNLLTTKAIIFDFDGTLTKRGSNRTTWERLWERAGYRPDECGELARRFFDKEINHNEWCQLTLEKFKSHSLNEAAVREIGKQLHLLEGVEDVLKELDANKILLFIVSGSIKQVIHEALGPNIKYFQQIEANDLRFDQNGVIEKIVGTLYDFEGKADFVTRIAAKHAISETEILYIGNSINDIYVKRNSGANTLLINPHFTHISDSEAWDFWISQVDSFKQVLKYVNFPNQKIAQFAEAAPDRLALLKSVSRINIREQAVIGNYCRFEEKARNELSDLSKRIMDAVATKVPTRENYLIWGAPGSGKTFLIEEIGANLGDDALFLKIDISALTKDEILRDLSRLAGVKGKCLCLLDEIDGKSDQTWLYDEIYKKLDLNECSDRESLVFVLLGSCPGGVKKLDAAIRLRYKGEDLLSRISCRQHFEISSLNIGDTLTVFISKVLSAAQIQKKRVDEIEKTACYYALAFDDRSSPRQLKILADKAVARMDSSGLLRYHDLFDRSGSTGFEFWSLWKEELNQCENERIVVNV